MSRKTETSRRSRNKESQESFDGATNAMSSTRPLASRIVCWNEAIAHRCQRRQKLQSQRRPDRKGRPVSPNRPLPTEHPYFSSDPRSARSSLANASWLRTSPRLPLRIFGLVASSVMIRPPTVGTFLTMRTVPMRYRTVAPAGPVG